MPPQVRDDLVDLDPYVSPARPARWRMNANESPHAPPRGVIDALHAALDEAVLNRYPRDAASDLQAALAAHHGWDPDGTWVANGSNEIFLHLFLAFAGAGRTVAVFEPTYGLHSSIARIAGSAIEAMPRTPDFEVDVADAAGHRAEVVVFCSPNNPTGNLERREAVLAAAASTETLVVVDEAYGEFAPPEASFATAIAEHPNLVVTKTFSKAWRLAGVRLGYLLAAPDVVRELARVRLPYHLSELAAAAGRAALDHSGETKELTAAIARERDRLHRELRRRGVEAFASRANFVLFRAPGARRVWEALLARDVLIRDYSSHPLLADCLRVTAGAPEETDAFLAALDGALRD